MQFQHSRSAWFYRMGFAAVIDFCVWILQVDGLQVAPFDQHPDGDRTLRFAGLTDEDWQAWFLQVMRLNAQWEEQRNEFHQALQRRAQEDPSNLFADQARRQFLEMQTPPSAWKGNTEVRERLNTLWEQYGPVSSQRKMRETELAMALRKGERTSHKRLYDELRPYHKRLPPLNICLIDYEQPIDYLVPPATLVMTIQEGQPEPEEFRERVIAAVAELAAQPGKRKDASPYSRGGITTGSFTPTYRMHARKPLQPAPPRQEITRLADPLRQMVIDALIGDRPSYGSVDPASVEFLREKRQPGWQLYEVLFQETDGEQHRMIVLLQQDDDGIWHWRSGGTSSDMQHHWSEIFAPVHDHPLLFLSFSIHDDSRQQYQLLAYGDVIDNGFHVELVRLVAKTGQIIEDRVEQGLVFLAMQQNQPFPLPMQAELYNNEGKLVWRQTAPDDGMPPWLRVRRR